MTSAYLTHRWRRFSLRTLLIAMAVLSLPCAYVAREWQTVQERKRAVLAVQKEIGGGMFELHSEPMPQISWARRAMGDRPRGGLIVPGFASEATLGRLRSAFPETKILPAPRLTPGKLVEGPDG